MQDSEDLCHSIDPKGDCAPKIYRKDKPKDSGEKTAYIELRQRGRLSTQMPDGYAKLKTAVDLLRQHFPGCNKFSRQDQHTVFSEDGSQETIVLPASVVLDPTKPDGFFVLGKKLGSGGYGSAKESWYLNQVGVMCDTDIEKVINNNKADSLKRTKAERDTVELVDGQSVLIKRTDDKKFYLSMKKRKGREFSSYWGDHIFQKTSFGDLLLMMRSIHEELERIHDLGIVHYDVKPENIMLFKEDGEWQAGLVDFGFSGRVGDKTREWGTYLYMHRHLVGLKTRPAGVWIDLHGEAALFGALLYQANSFLYEKLQVRCRVAEGQQSGRAITRVNYSFDSGTFRPQVPRKYQTFLIMLLLHLESCRCPEATGQEVLACLRLLELQERYDRNNEVEPAELEEVVQSFGDSQNSPSLKEAFDKFLSSLRGEMQELFEPASPTVLSAAGGVGSRATMFSEGDSSQERFKPSHQSWQLLKNKAGPA